jgi:hypothetical protein
MQAVADTQPAPDITSCSYDEESSSSSPSTPSPRASATPPDQLSKILANNRASGQKLRSKVWLHFTKAADYKTSGKATCVHCGKTFTSRRGSTTTMNQHLEKLHFDTPERAEFLAR